MLPDLKPVEARRYKRPDAMLTGAGVAQSVLAATALADDVEAEAWQRKVLRDFFESERLNEIPASRKKREPVG